MSEARLHIAIASGGTGGHFYPTLAIARAAVRQGYDITLFVAGHHADEQLRIAQAQGLRAVRVPASRVPGFGLGMVTFPFCFLWSVVQGYRAVCRAAPDIVLGMGSFAAVPVCLGALLRRLPLVLHEGNSLMGRANRILSRWARAVATSLPLGEGLAPACRTVRTGMPLRDTILEAARRGTASYQIYDDLGLVNGAPTVLVFGGSQGARFINDLLSECVQVLSARDSCVQFIHLTGTDDNAALASAYARCGFQAHIVRSDPDIERCYLASGLVICRGGASSLSELALFGKPGIIIPLPTAADDHQTVNARVLAAHGAVWVMPQADASAEALAGLIADWLREPAPWAERARRLGELACPDASAAVVRLVNEVLAEDASRP